MERILTFLQTLNMTDPMLLYMQIGLFVMIVIAVFMIVGYMTKHHTIQKLFAKITADFAEQERLRNLEYEQLLEMEGALDKEPRMRRLTKALQLSGIKTKYPEMSAELFVFTVAGLCLLAGLGIGIIFHSSLYGLLAAALVFLAICAYINLMMAKNEQRVEKDVMKFINLLENMSHTEGSIGDMLGRTVPYLSEPLKSSVERCYYDIKTTGNIDASLAKLAERTDYKQLRDVFNYLRICSSYNENYTEIIAENREIIRMHLAFQKEKRSIKNSALLDMGIIGAAGIVIIFVVSFMVDNVQVLLTSNIIGKAIMAAIIGTLAYGIFMIIKNDK